MNVQEILSFYKRNALFESKHKYDEKFQHLEFFHQYDEVNIETVTEYCALRKLTGVKNSTINRELNVIKSAFNYYLKHKHTVNLKNVFNGFKLFEEDYMPRFLNAYECQKLLKSSLRYNNQKLHDFIVLALNTGCRSSELTTLTWDNVHMHEKYIVIRNSLSKNKKTVYKPLNNSSIAALHRLRDHNKFVFYNATTNKQIKSFRRGFLLASERADLAPLRIHDLRHTFASFLVKQGVPIYHVSTLLGHSDTRITQRYAHLAPEHLHDILKCLPSLTEN